MLRSVWKTNLHTLFKQRNWAIAMSIGLLISNMMLVMNTYIKKERVIVVPAHFKQTFWAEGESISKEYLEEMTIFIAGLLLNVTPESLGYQKDVVLRYVSPEFYNIFQQRLIEEEEKLRKEGLCTTFRPKEVKVNEKSGEVIISGILSQYIGDKKVGQVEESYKAIYGYSSGILLLKGFEIHEE
jgi:conjugal transfer pilus assembly protein TraE